MERLGFARTESDDFAHPSIAEDNVLRHHVLYRKPNQPAAPKAAMALLGPLEPVYRLPMVPPAPHNLSRVEKVLETLGLLVHQ